MTTTSETAIAPAAPERQMRADARRNRERILEAARTLFARREGDVLMDEIAREAGVGVGTLYRHFPDREALMGEVVRERFKGFNACMRKALDPAAGLGPFDAFASTMRDNAAAVADDAATRFAFMTGDERVFAVAAAEMEEFTLLSEQLVARARAAGELNPIFQASDIPMVMCGVCATIDQHKVEWDWRKHLELVIAGMRPVSEASGPRAAQAPGAVASAPQRPR